MCCFFTELELRGKKGLFPPDVILLTVEDPLAQVGSGGATLNALLVVAEHISARQGYTVSVHINSKSIMIHCPTSTTITDIGSYSCACASSKSCLQEVVSANQKQLPPATWTQAYQQQHFFVTEMATWLYVQPIHLVSDYTNPVNL